MHKGRDEAMKEAAGPGTENMPPRTQPSAQEKAVVLPKTRADVSNVCIIYVKQTFILMLFLRVFVCTNEGDLCSPRANRA